MLKSRTIRSALIALSMAATFPISNAAAQAFTTTEVPLVLPTVDKRMTLQDVDLGLHQRVVFSVSCDPATLPAFINTKLWLATIDTPSIVAWDLRAPLQPTRCTHGLRRAAFWGTKAGTGTITFWEHHKGMRMLSRVRVTIHVKPTIGN